MPEPVVVNDRGNKHEHPGNNRKVGERQDLVAREHDGQNDHQRHQDVGDGKGGRMTNTHGGVKPI